MIRPSLSSVSTIALVLAVAVGTVVMTGCSSRRGERLDPGQTTRAELRSAEILPVALLEFSDQAPRRLIEDLRQLPIISQTQGQVTILMGDINNRTDIVSSSEFEMAASRLRNNLINSPIARDEMAFVERRARMQQLAARERVAEGQFLADPEDYNPATTYALNGDFYRVGRAGDDVNRYYMEFQLVHFGTNQIVFSDRFEVAQTRRAQR